MEKVKQQLLEAIDKYFRDHQRSLSPVRKDV